MTAEAGQPPTPGPDDIQDVPHPPAGVVALFDPQDRGYARRAWRLGYAAALAEVSAAEPDGPVLAAVRADLAELGEIKGGANRTYAAMALWLAGVIDKRGQEDGPSTTARLATELRGTMAALTSKGGEHDDGFQQFEDAASRPVL